MFTIKNILSLALFGALHLSAQAAILPAQVASALGVTQKDVSILLNATNYASIDVKTWTHKYNYISDAQADAWSPETKNTFLTMIKAACLHAENATILKPTENSRYGKADIAARAIRPSDIVFPGGISVPAQIQLAVVNEVRNRMMAAREEFLTIRKWLHQILTCQQRTRASCLACKASASSVLAGIEAGCGAAALTASAASGGGLTVPAGLALAGCTAAALGKYGADIDKCIEAKP